MFVVRSIGEWCHGVGLVVTGKGTVVVREAGRFLRVDAVRGGELCLPFVVQGIVRCLARWRPV